MIISIHGHGIDIEARIGDVSQLAAVSSSVADKLAERLRGGPVPPPTSAPDPIEEPPHDFDIVKSVIQHGDATVLQAIIALANGELERREANN